MFLTLLPLTPIPSPRSGARGAELENAGYSRRRIGVLGVSRSAFHLSMHDDFHYNYGMTTKNRLLSTSKFLSLVLRHQPEVIGMQLDSEGWLPIDELIRNANQQGKGLTLELLHEVVASCEKKRFALSDDGLMIRANQGHSIPQVELNLSPIEPPNLLYHGTVAPFLESIREQGLLKRSRNHVHLSTDIDTAKKVGTRRGKPVILTILAQAMHQSGHTFYLSANGVWLTDAVPVPFIEFPEET